MQRAARHFAERLAGWQQKAIREAKLQGDWTGPDEAYEAAARDFLFHCWRPAARFAAEAARLSAGSLAAGAVNGLAQTLLKLTVARGAGLLPGHRVLGFQPGRPGQPPRRWISPPASAPCAEAARPGGVAGAWRDGRVKQAVIARTLALRRAVPGAVCPRRLSARWTQPARSPGTWSHSAGARNAEVCLTVVPRLPHRLLSGGDTITIPPAAWRDTRCAARPNWSAAACMTLSTAVPDGDLPRTLPVGPLLRIVLSRCTARLNPRDGCRRAPLPALQSLQSRGLTARRSEKEQFMLNKTKAIAFAAALVAAPMVGALADAGASGTAAVTSPGSVAGSNSAGTMNNGVQSGTSGSYGSSVGVTSNPSTPPAGTSMSATNTTTPMSSPNTGATATGGSDSGSGAGGTGGAGAGGAGAGGAGGR